MYNQHTAYLTNQVHFSTLNNVMLPSQSWTDAITMPHHVEWVRVRDPGPKEGGACHYVARHYPCQREEGRRHCLGPCQQNGHYYGPKEGGACHHAARHYPCQCEEGRRHCLGPCQQNGHYYYHSVAEETPPQGPYLVGPPEPNTEASQKQMYFASEQVYAYMNKQELVQWYKTVKLCKAFVNITLFQLFVRVPIPTFNVIYVKVAILTYS